MSTASNRPLGFSAEDLLRYRQQSGGVAYARRPVQASSTPGPSLLPFFVVAGWCLALSLDTILRGMVPMGGLLRMALPAMFLLAAGAARSQQGWKAPRAVSTGAFVLAAGGILSCVLSAAPLLGGIKLTLYLAVLCPLVLSPAVVRHFAPNSPGLKLLCGVVLATLALCIVYSPLGRGRGIFLNPNGLGVFCLLAAPLMMYLTHHPNRLWKSWAVAGVAMVVLLVLSTLSRGAAGGLAAFFCVYFALRRSASIRSIVVVGIVSFVLGMIGLAMSDSAHEYVYKDGEELFDDARQVKFTETMENFAKRPILGYGFGLSWLVDSTSTSRALASGRLSTSVGEFGNSTLAMLSGGGLVVTGAFFAVLAGVFFCGLKALRSNPRPGPTRQYLLCLLAGIAGLLVNAQAEAWLMAPLTWSTILFWLYCGMVLHVASMSRPLPAPGYRLPHPYKR